MRLSMSSWISRLAKAAFPTVALLLALAACSEDSGGAATAQTGTPIQVVVTTNIMADWVEIVGGDRVEVFSLVRRAQILTHSSPALRTLPESPTPTLC